jgi:molybdopterin-guanine dinucleotide biosynthesis protein A
LATTRHKETALKLGVVILTGGASSRMGRDKAVLDWGGERAIDRLGTLAHHLGAHAILSVGRIDYGLPFLADTTPLGGPVGGIVAGVACLQAKDCRRVLVLAVDAPTLRPPDLAPLIAAPSPGAAFANYPLPLVLDPSALPPHAQADWPVHRLVEVCGLALLICPSDAQARVRGANTPEERDALMRTLP